MNTDFILQMVKPYLPTITQKFLPQVNTEIAAALFHEDENLEDGEVESVFLISRDGKDAFIRTAQLDKDARIVRTSAPRKVSDYLSDIINQAFTK
jgi:hypothetical protein